MPTPEDIVRYRMREEAKARELRQQEQLAELCVLWQKLESTAKQALKRLGAKGWPGARMIAAETLVSTTNWRGKAIVHKRVVQMAAWELKSRYHDTPGLPDTVTLFGSDGKLYQNEYGSPTLILMPSLAITQYQLDRAQWTDTYKSQLLESRAAEIQDFMSLIDSLGR